MPRPLLAAVCAGGMLAAAALVMPAFAHPGAHDGLSWSGLVQHLATAWHVWPIVAGAAAGLAVLLMGQRRQASARVAARSRKERS